MYICPQSSPLDSGLPDASHHAVMHAAACRFVFVFTVMAATDSVQTTSTISMQV